MGLRVTIAGPDAELRKKLASQKSPGLEVESREESVTLTITHATPEEALEKLRVLSSILLASSHRETLFTIAKSAENEAT